MIQPRVYLSRHLSEPNRLFVAAHLTLLGGYGLAYDDLSRSFERFVQVEGWAQYHNLWTTYAAIKMHFPRVEDRETQGGLALRRPLYTQYILSATTNTSKKLWLDVEGKYGNYGDDSWETFFSSTLHAAAGQRLNFSLQGHYRYLDALPLFLYQSQAGQDVIGATRYREFQLELRGLWSVTRRLTLQLMHQLLLSHALSRSTYTLSGTIDTTPDSTGDATMLDLIVNAVLRWDFDGGSSAYLVYKLDGALEQTGSTATSFNLARRMSDLLSERQTHLLLLKLSVGWQL